MRSECNLRTPPHLFQLRNLCFLSILFFITFIAPLSCKNLCFRFGNFVPSTARRSLGSKSRTTSRHSRIHDRRRRSLACFRRRFLPRTKLKQCEFISDLSGFLRIQIASFFLKLCLLPRPPIRLPPVSPEIPLSSLTSASTPRTSSISRCSPTALHIFFVKVTVKRSSLRAAVREEAAEQKTHSNVTFGSNQFLADMVVRKNRTDTSDLRMLECARN